MVSERFAVLPIIPDTFEVQWISSTSEWDNLLKHLSNLRVIYLDLEGHSFRSYRGITCLIQIYDGTTVYFLDCLKLYHHMYLFNTITTKPDIIKVVFGGDNDIINMEKDFSVYFVGLIDLQIVYKVLHPETEAIAYNSLVSELFDLTIGKELRCSDFRKRPLHERQNKYAYLDVYFLPYAFKKLMVNVSKSHLIHIQTKCANVCKKRYVKPILKPILNRNDFIDQIRHLVAKQVDCNPELVLPRNLFNKLISCNPKTEESVRKHMPFLDSSWNRTKHMEMLLLSITCPVEDWTTVIDTANRELGLQCSSASQAFCFKCNSSGHVKRECTISNEEAKIIRKQVLADNPSIRIKETRRRNAKKKASPEGRKKRNRKETLRKRKKLLELNSKSIENHS